MPFSATAAFLSPLVWFPGPRHAARRLVPLTGTNAESRQDPPDPYVDKQVCGRVGGNGQALKKQDDEDAPKRQAIRAQIDENLRAERPLARPGRRGARHRPCPGCPGLCRSEASDPDRRASCRALSRSMTNCVPTRQRLPVPDLRDAPADHAVRGMEDLFARAFGKPTPATGQGSGTAVTTL